MLRQISFAHRLIRAYGFGETRVATFALLTFTALSLSRSCGVVIAKLSGHAASFRSSPTVFGGWLDARVYLDPHLIWQATESYVKRGDAFGLIPHELPPNPVLLTTEAVYSLSTAAGESAISKSRFSAKFRPRNRVHRDHDTAMDQNQVLHIGRVDFRNDNRLFGIKREDRFFHQRVHRNYAATPDLPA